MKFKLGKLIPVAVASIMCVSMMAGCGGNDHTHTYSYEDKDATSHIKTCTGCDDVNETEAHVYADANDTTCDLCGHVRTITPSGGNTGDTGNTGDSGNTGNTGDTGNTQQNGPAEGEEIGDYVRRILDAAYGLQNYTMDVSTGNSVGIYYNNELMTATTEAGYLRVPKAAATAASDDGGAETEDIPFTLGLLAEKSNGMFSEENPSYIEMWKMHQTADIANGKFLEVAHNTQMGDGPGEETTVDDRISYYETDGTTIKSYYYIDDDGEGSEAGSATLTKYTGYADEAGAKSGVSGAKSDVYADLKDQIDNMEYYVPDGDGNEPAANPVKGNPYELADYFKMSEDRKTYTARFLKLDVSYQAPDYTTPVETYYEVNITAELENGKLKKIVCEEEDEEIDLTMMAAMIMPGAEYIPVNEGDKVTEKVTEVTTIGFSAWGTTSVTKPAQLSTEPAADKTETVPVVGSEATFKEAQKKVLATDGTIKLAWNDEENEKRYEVYVNESLNLARYDEYNQVEIQGDGYTYTQNQLAKAVTLWLNDGNLLTYEANLQDEGGYKRIASWKDATSTPATDFSALVGQLPELIRVYFRASTTANGEAKPLGELYSSFEHTSFTNLAGDFYVGADKHTVRIGTRNMSYDYALVANLRIDDIYIAIDSNNQIIANCELPEVAETLGTTVTEEVWHEKMADWKDAFYTATVQSVGGADLYKIQANADTIIVARLSGGREHEYIEYTKQGDEDQYNCVVYSKEGEQWVKDERGPESLSNIESYYGLNYLFGEIYVDGDSTTLYDCADKIKFNPMTGMYELKLDSDGTLCISFGEGTVTVITRYENGGGSGRVISGKGTTTAEIPQEVKDAAVDAPSMDD